MDPIAIITSCIDLVKEIYKLNESIKADDKSCAELLQRVWNLHRPLEIFVSQDSGLQSSVEELFNQLQILLKDIFLVVSGRSKNKKSIKGKAVNALNTYCQRVGPELTNFTTNLNKLLVDASFITLIDIKSIVLDLRAAFLQGQEALYILDSVFEMQPKPLHYYDRRSILGSGTFGDIHRMINKIDDGIYAVKVITVSKVIELGVSSERMVNEAVILQQLNHPNVVRYFTSYFSQKNILFNVVMELCDGGSLASAVEDESVSLVTIGKWFQQMASALNYLHFEKSVQHRDIKPENIMLQNSGEVIKLVDLGSACLAQSSGSMTKIGTNIYNSYEKAFHAHYDGRDDVWAAGCVFAELLTKKRLQFPIYNYLDPVIDDRRHYLIQDCVEINNEIGSIISHMLKPLENDRCTSQFLSQLVKKLHTDSANCVTQNDVKDLRYTEGNHIGFYSGTLMNSMRHGSGTFYYINGSRKGDTYVGQWMKNERCGLGLYTTANNHTYYGNYREGLCNGLGETKFGNGDRHYGLYRDGVPSGIGKYYHAADCSVYEGCYSQGRRHGIGALLFGNGDMYHGEFADGLFHGNGKFSFSNGNCYKGKFEKGRRHGKGRFTYANGDSYSGTFKNDNFVEGIV